MLTQRKRGEVQLKQRARIVLLAAKGMQNKEVALKVGLDRRQVALWRARFLGGGVGALRKDVPRSSWPTCQRDASREALASYRTAAAVEESLTRVLPARPPSPLPGNGRGPLAQRGFRPGLPLLRDGVMLAGP